MVIFGGVGVGGWGRVLLSTGDEFEMLFYKVCMIKMESWVFSLSGFSKCINQ